MAAKVAEFPDGELRQIRVHGTAEGESEGAFLLARINGEFYATGASCSHYSAPLAKGVVAKDKMHVICPWHDAAFDLRTGEVVRGPGLEGIPTYAVSIEDGNVVVDLPKHMEDFETMPMAKRVPEDDRVFVIIGGGAAGVNAADALRQEGFTGKLLMLTEEHYLPYDRPVLSKNFAKASDMDSIALRSQEYFDEHDIEVQMGTTVEKVDAQAKEIVFNGGQRLKYDKALVCTGARPRKLPVKGGDLPGVFELRNPGDVLKISGLCEKGKKVAIVGSSFIGMEVAATLKRRGCEVTVIGMESVPFERVLGRRVGEAVKSFFTSKGVTFIGNATVEEVTRSEGKSGATMTVSLKGGKGVKCSAIVVGAGVVPHAGMVSGVDKFRDGSILTDEFLESSASDLFAAGDLATYRQMQTGEQLRVEHWDVATSQGRVAAKNMMGRSVFFDQTPFFWTSLFGKNLRYVGNCKSFDELLVDGDISKLDFVVFYCSAGAVKAVATMGRDPVAVAAGELMRMGKMPTVEELKHDTSTGGLPGLCQKLSCEDA